MKLRLLGVLLLAGSFAFLPGCADDDDDGLGPVPTATTTSPPPVTATRTSPPANTSTPTATATGVPTGTTAATATPTGLPTGTVAATFTPTPEAIGGLGVRIFSIAPPSANGTGLFPSLLAGQNAASAVAGGPLALVAGTVAAEGIAPLSLRDDVIVGLTQPVGVICTKYYAEGSGGTIDCDGGTAYDVIVTEEPGPDAPPPTVQTGQDTDAGPGAATLMVMQQTLQSPPGTDCTTQDYSSAPLVTSYFTTANATATKGAATITLPGMNFDCDTWTVSDSDGMLASPATTFNTLAGGDTANITRLDD
jgi:hypothetical protein